LKRRRHRRRARVSVSFSFTKTNNKKQLTFFPSSCLLPITVPSGVASARRRSRSGRGFPRAFSGELSCRAGVDVWRRHLEPSGSAYRKGALTAFSGRSGGNRPYRPGLPVRHFPVAFCRSDTVGSRLGGSLGSSLEHGGLPGEQPSARRRIGATRRILTRSANPRVAPRYVREGIHVPSIISPIGVRRSAVKRASSGTDGFFGPASQVLYENEVAGIGSFPRKVRRQT